jgi:predicted GH43/DUF377 family glycosyl hydrolase
MRAFRPITVPIAVAMVLSGMLAIDLDAAEAQPGSEFPDELVHFEPLTTNIVFAGTGQETWDRSIRERSYILREGNRWKMWYNGYHSGRKPTHFLGLATSEDGLSWKRAGAEPIYNQGWIEDLCVIQRAGTYYLFSEGSNDIAHLLKSADGEHWVEQGNLDIRNVDGTRIKPGPYGTPAVIVEDGVWNLFYERDDSAVWLARSSDLKTWTNVQDEPVLKRGPEAYDRFAVAFNQVIKYRGHYYANYHASADEKWSQWSSNLAVSSDLVHWKKYPGNPILPADPVDPKRSSAYLVQDGDRFRLYATHPDVKVYISKKPAVRK